MKFLLLLMLLSSCAYSDFQRRNVDEYFNSSGIVQYFLPDLPAWANTVHSVQCTRAQSIRFFDFEKLNASFGLDYQQLVQLQLAFNTDRREDMALTEEERLFYSASERVQADIVPFKVPNFKKINLVAIDPYIKAPTYRELFALLNSASFNQAQPVFISLCYSEKEVRQLIEQVDFTGSYAVISSAMFSPFGPDLKLQTGVALDVNRLLGEEKDITLYAPGGRTIPEISGKFKTKTY